MEIDFRLFVSCFLVASCLLYGVISLRSPMTIVRLLSWGPNRVNQFLAIKDERFSLLEKDPTLYAVKYQQQLKSIKWGGVFALVWVVLATGTIIIALKLQG
jgi:hypothetical protein